MPCKCGSDRIADVSGKCSDMCFVRIGDKEHDGYVPSGSFGKSDYIEFKVCLDCGQMQGEWPHPPLELELDDSEEDAA